MHQRKTFWEIFDRFNISIVLLASQVNRKIESDIEFSRSRFRVTLHILAKQRIHLCQNDGKTPGFCFVSLVFFLSGVLKIDKQCAN